MHLNCHTAYPRLAVYYFRKKNSIIEVKSKFQGHTVNSIYHLQLFIINAPPFLY